MRFLTITIYGERGRLGAQIQGLEQPIWGNDPDQLASALHGAIQQMSPVEKRNLFTPLLEAAQQQAGG